MKLIIVLVASLIAFGAQADDQSTGCGLGWKVTSKYTWIATTTRGTTNSFTTPYGITTGTSGCAKHTIVKNEQTIRSFVNASYDSLSLDIATGGGENLTALTHLLGCSSSSSGQIGMRMQGSYQTLFPTNGTSDQFVNDVLNMISIDSNLSQSCQLQLES